MDSSSAPTARQQRSRETQHRIFEAGCRLLERGGADALTMAAVAAEAEVSVGSVYRRFGDKERLLLALQAWFTDRFRLHYQERIASIGLTADTPPAEAIGEVVTGMAEVFQANGPLLRVFMLLGLGNQAVYERASQAGAEGNRAFRDLALLAGPALRHHEDVETAIDFAYRMAYATCAHRVLHGEHLESPRTLSWEALIAQLRRAVVGYLLSPADAAGVRTGEAKGGWMM